MTTAKRQISVVINQIPKTLLVGEEETLLRALRRFGYTGAKYGCDDGTCGVCVVLINGEPATSCNMKAVEADGKNILTIEGLSQGQHLHPIQQAFVETGAIQCGYCTPAQVLVVKALLDKNPHPSETEIRAALDQVLCRCTGYVRAVDAAQRAAEMLQGGTVEALSPLHRPLPADPSQAELPESFYRRDGSRHPLPPLIFTPAGMQSLKVVGKAERKVDGNKLAQGRPVFTDDFSLPGMLYGALLTSPHAHARITRIDASRARSLPGVVAVLTHQDIPRVKYASGGQTYPQPLPYDQVSLDTKVRHVGDRVAILAAETPEIAQQALSMIEVDYEILPAVVDPQQAMQDGAPIIHDEPDTEGIHDARHNIVHHIAAEVGDVDTAFAEADFVLAGEYRTPKQQHVHLEPHVCITYLDEDDRLVIRTSTQVPFHIRRMVAPLINLPVKKIRVIKPRIGGGFGNKQEMILEDLCAHLTLATGRPVRMEYTRAQEFIGSRSRHASIMRYKVGVRQGKVTAASLYLIGNTGAYGTHGLTVNMVGGFKGLTLYNPPNARFSCDVVYTNTPPAGALRGYGATQCQYGIEVLMEEVAEHLGLDVAEFKRNNWIKVGDTMHLAEALGEGRAGTKQSLLSSGLADCVSIGLKASDFYAKRQKNQAQTGRYRRGMGMSVAMHGTAVANLDMAAATLKMNDDGSFNLMVGATDLGTGADTVLSQIAAEVLETRPEDIIVYAADTDLTPFDKGAYASSTTYVSGGAVHKAAEDVKGQIIAHAADMLGIPSQALRIEDQHVIAADGRSVTYAEVGLSSLHQLNQHQIIASASHAAELSPPPMAAQFVEIVVDTETGVIDVERMLMVVDCGRVVNPITAAGQVEGGMAMALGFALTEEMLFTPDGQPLTTDLLTYRIAHAAGMPAMDVIFVQTYEPSGPFGVKSVAEMALDGAGPGIASALHNATGVWIREIPYTPARVKEGLRASAK